MSTFIVEISCDEKNCSSERGAGKKIVVKDCYSINFMENVKTSNTTRVILFLSKGHEMTSKGVRSKYLGSRTFDLKDMTFAQITTTNFTGTIRCHDFEEVI
jgi:hypothetical protein